MVQRSPELEAAYQLLRRYARQAALQAIYEQDFLGGTDASVCDMFLLGRLSFAALWPPPPENEDEAEPPDPADADDLLDALREQLVAVARQRAAAAGDLPDAALDFVLAKSRDDLTHLLDEQGLQFARQLTRGVLENRESLDARIGEAAINWSLHRMAATDRNVLRLGAFELLMTDQPPRVAINEAIELAKRFGTAQSSQFVNGILDRLLHQSGRAEE